MKHIAQAVLQLMFFWVFLVLYCVTMVPLAVVIAFIPAAKREKDE